MGREEGKITDAVLANLTNLVGAKAKITFEFDVEVPYDIPEGRVRSVSENLIP